MNQFFYHTRFLQANIETEDFLPTVSYNNYGAGFICLQEVLHNQLYNVLGSLNNVSGTDTRTVAEQSLPEGPVWSHIGVAREDGKMKGEYSPILYQTAIFDLLHSETTWLSPTPDRPSKGWDAGSERLLTSGVFEHKRTKRRLAVFNTHLDNAGEKARKNSIAIILNVIARMTSDWHKSSKEQPHHSTIERLDYVLSGDFNSFPTQEAYKALEESNTMMDVHKVVPAQERYGGEITFTGFEPGTEKDKDEIGRIDFVWLGPKQRVHNKTGSMAVSGWLVQGYSVLPNVFDDGIFYSDHRCVVADAILL